MLLKNYTSIFSNIVNSNQVIELKCLLSSTKCRNVQLSSISDETIFSDFTYLPNSGLLGFISATNWRLTPKKKTSMMIAELSKGNDKGANAERGK